MCQVSQVVSDALLAVMLFDVAIYGVLVAVFTYALSAFSSFVWVYLCAFVAVSVIRLRNTFEHGMTQWFTVAKFVGVLAGVVVLAVVRRTDATPALWTRAISVFLFVNVGEVLARDAQQRHWTSALTAVHLMATIPFTSSHATVVNGWYMYRLSPAWITVYSSWNAAFTYANDFAWTTRLILVVPLVATITHGMDAWLGVRTMSLFVHLTMRAVHFTKYYTPGASVVTPLIGTVGHDERIAGWWSAANFVLACALLPL